MGDGTILIETLLLAGVAAFLFFRLRSVLGRRTGTERDRPPPLAARTPDVAPEANPGDRARPTVVPFPGAELGAPSEPLSLAELLRLVAKTDPTFDEPSFLSGARIAFGMIVEAYAKGDVDALRPLLDDGVFRDFASAIEARAKAGRTLVTTIVDTQSVDPVAARVDGRIVQVTVRFVTHQIVAITAADGSVLEGDLKAPVEVDDIWTFARDAASPDPNWRLVSTRAPA